MKFRKRPHETRRKRLPRALITLLLLLSLAVHGCAADIALDEIPEYEEGQSDAYTVVNGNTPFFTEEELADAGDSFEYYPELDSLGRCGTCEASVGQDLMPTEEREDISSVHPSGWHSGTDPAKWNRGHLIAFQLAGENANERNLITLTRTGNETMIPYENMIADYVKETDNHVLYRVTPMFDGDDLVATGVLLEAESVEDEGDGVLFNVFCYNIQPDVEIDYATGESKAEDTTASGETDAQKSTAASGEKSAADGKTQTGTTTEDDSDDKTYVVNRNNGKIHISGKCPATDPDSASCMKNTKTFSTYEKASAWSKEAFPDQQKRNCGNCWE